MTCSQPSLAFAAWSASVPGPVRLGLAGAVAQSLGGVLLRLEHLAAAPLAESVRAISGGFRGVAPPGQQEQEVA